MRRFLFNAAKFIALLALISLAATPLLHATLPWSDDGQLHFWRIVELDHCLRNGYLFPRWMPDMAYGYGYPLLNYYAPLSVYLAEGFHLLGLDFTAALQAAFVASLAMSALGAYLWARDSLGETGGLLAAVAYAYAPYILYDAIWRGNLAEALALGLLPWTFWRLRRLTANPTRRNVGLAALPFALLILSHNITALIVAPLLAGYGLVLWLSTGRSRRALSGLIVALGLGVALSAFFWLPAFFERNVVQTEELLTSYFDFRHNFLSLGQIVSAPLPIDQVWMNPPVPRSLGWPAIALAALGLAGIWKAGARLPRSRTLSFRWEIAAVFAGFILFAFLTLPPSGFLWESVPLLPYAEFPWRFLGLASLMAAWLAGASTRWMRQWRVRARALGVGLAALLTVAFALPWLYPRYLSPIQNPTPAGLIAFERHGGTLGTTSANEFLTNWVEELPDPTALQAQYRSGGAIRRLDPATLPEGATIVSERWQIVEGDLTVDSPRDWTATLRLFYFPGWRVTVDGQPVVVSPSAPHGLLRFDLPAGEVDIKVRFGTTPWRLTGTFLSLVGMAVFLAMIVPRCRDESESRPRLQQTPRPAWIAALVAVGFVLAVKIVYLDRHDTPLRYTGFDGQRVRGVGAPAQIRFDDDIRLLGHDPAAPTVQAGGTVPIRLYWTADAPPDEEYGSFLHLVDVEGHLWAQSDHQHPGGYPTPRWRPGEYNRDEHALRVPAGTPPGQYTLRAGLVAHDGVGLDVLDERGAPVGTSVALGAVTVTRPDAPSSAEELDVTHRLDAPLGPLTLLGADLDRAQAAPGETLLLVLAWQAERAPDRNYRIIIEIVDGEGRVAAQIDVPPVAASYPTDQWPAGEVVRGQHWLPLPADLKSGDYDLRLCLSESDAAPVMLGAAGRFKVVAPDRQTAIPPMSHRLDANFAGRATLLGYDLEPNSVRPGASLRLTLYWRAERPLTRSFAVFTHLLDAESRIVAQHDGLPANWTRPTTGWLPGEVIVDAHELRLETDVPPGEYPLEVGLYDPETNLRMPVLNAAGEPVDDRVLLEPVPVESEP